MGVAVHVVRTFLLVGVLTIVFITIDNFELGWAGILLTLVFIIGFIWLSSRWHAHWAPIADVVDSHSWRSSQSENMETVVEKAITSAANHGGTIHTQTLRISIYNRSHNKQISRIIIGDGAVYLGSHGELFWFFIEDSYHAGKDGLVAYNRESADVVFHRSKNEITYRGRGNKAHIIKVIFEGDNQTLNLASLVDT